MFRLFQNCMSTTQEGKNFGSTLRIGLNRKTQCRWIIINSWLQLALWYQVCLQSNNKIISNNWHCYCNGSRACVIELNGRVQAYKVFSIFQCEIERITREGATLTSKCTGMCAAPTFDKQIHGYVCCTYLWQAYARVYVLHGYVCCTYFWQENAWVSVLHLPHIPFSDHECANCRGAEVPKWFGEGLGKNEKDKIAQNVWLD